jgi:hypothetical protein
MTKKVPIRKPTPPAIQPMPPIPTDEPGQQPTPDADALGEVEGVLAGLGLNLADISAQLAQAATSAARDVGDRFFGRDSMDVDIGFHEGLRHLTLHSFAGLTAMNNMFQYTAGIKAMNMESIANQRADDSAFYDGVIKSDSAFHSGLLKAYGLETDNEVLSTVALGKVVSTLVQDVTAIKDAISAARPKT